MGLHAAPDGTIWVTAHHAATLDEIDPATNGIAGTLSVSDGGDIPARFVATPTTLFEVSYAGDDIFAIDPTTRTVTGKLTLPLENCCYPVYGAGSFWVLAFSSATAVNANRLERVDPATGHMLATVSLPNAQGLVFGAGGIWGMSNGRVFRLDPATNTVVARIRSNAQPSAYAGGSI